MIYKWFIGNSVEIGYELDERREVSDALTDSYWYYSVELTLHRNAFSLVIL